MGVAGWVRVLIVASIVGLLLFDFVVHVRKAHIPSLGEAAVWSAAHVASPSSSASGRGSLAAHHGNGDDPVGDQALQWPPEATCPVAGRARGHALAESRTRELVVMRLPET